MIILLTIATLLAIITILLVGGIPSEGAINTAVYHSPVLIALFAIVTILTLIASIIVALKKNKERGVCYYLSFYLMHYGIAIALIGCGLTYFKSKNISFATMLQDPQMRSIIPPQLTGTGKELKLKFKIKAENFKVVNYEPKSYTHWTFDEKISKVRKASTKNNPQALYLIKNLKDKEFIDFGKFKKVPLAKFKKKNGDWKKRVRLDEDNIVQLENLTPKSFSCTIKFAPTTAIDESETVTKKTIMNHPVSYQGWRIFLMGYDRSQRDIEDGLIRYVSLTARKDPGRIPVHIGFWAIMIGTFLWAFAPKKRNLDNIEG